MSFSHFEKGKKSKTKSFYIALIICIIAIGATAFTTYDSFVHYGQKKNNLAPENNPETNQITEDKETNNDIRGITIDENQSSNTVCRPCDEIPENNNDIDETLESAKEITVSAKKQPSQIIYPCSEQIIREYSGDNPVFSNTMGDWRIHSGVDFKADQGEKVKSISDGSVKDIYKDLLLGTTVAIEHDAGFTAFYSGLDDSTLVCKNDVVKAGQEIGAINSIPSEILDGYHLHLSIKKDGQSVDPIDILE